MSGNDRFKRPKSPTRLQHRYEARLNQQDERIRQYCHAHTTDMSVVLQQLERDTHRKTLAPQMLCGKTQGQLLRMISRMIKPKRILEIGTFTGYATICLSAGLPQGGSITTIEINDELQYLSNVYFEAAGIEQQVIPIIGDANEIIPTLEETFDLVFLDGAKIDYARQYPMLIEKMSPGAILLADNALWSGSVVNEKRSRQAQALHAFNDLVQADAVVENVLLPLRDGLMMIRVLES